MDRAKIVDWVDESLPDGSILLWDGLEDAFVGIVTNFFRQTVACYDYDKIVQLLVSRDAMTPDEAAEYVDHNIAGGWVGEKTPLILTRYQ